MNKLSSSPYIFGTNTCKPVTVIVIVIVIIIITIIIITLRPHSHTHTQSTHSYNHRSQPLTLHEWHTATHLDSGLTYTPTLMYPALPTMYTASPHRQRVRRMRADTQPQQSLPAQRSKCIPVSVHYDTSRRPHTHTNTITRMRTHPMRSQAWNAIAVKSITVTCTHTSLTLTHTYRHTHTHSHTHTYRHTAARRGNVGRAPPIQAGHAALLPMHDTRGHHHQMSPLGEPIRGRH